MYGEGDEALLEIFASAEGILPKCSVPGIEMAVSLTNGLSELPRLLTGFDDPEYRESGADLMKIRDVERFGEVLDEARQDYDKYIFDY